MKSFLLFLLTVLLAFAPAHAQSQTLNLPPRVTNALTGSQFSRMIVAMPQTAREYWVLNQVMAGNIPGWMRNLVPVTITKSISGVSHTVTYYALPDYLSIGSDDDYFQEPMSPILAQHLCNLLNCTLPTRLMVDQIWTNSAVKMTPVTFSPSVYVINSVPVFILESNGNRAQRNNTTNAYPLGALVSGDKKDMIISSLIYTNLTANVPKPVVIYGWVQPNGVYIQQPYNGHEESYMDYSHGARLIQNAVTLDGVPDTVTNILASATLNSLLSGEGQLIKNYYTVDSSLTPFVLQPPYSQNAIPGSAISLSVLASGEAPFTYQWKLNGANLASATNTTLTITNVQSINGGAYTVTVLNTYGSFTSLPAVVKVVTNQYPLIFSDDLTQNTSINWNLFTSSSDYTADWAYDYGLIGYSWNTSGFTVPPSPSLINAPTRAARFTVNNISSNLVGLNIYPKNQSFSNNFALKFDMWINYPGGANGSGAAGTTEYMLCGINHTGTEVNWAATSAPATDGLWFAADGEGGSSRDYRAYLGNPSGTETDLMGSASGLAATIHTAAPFPTLFPATRFESVGCPGKNWVACEVSQSNNIVTWKFDDTIVAQRTNTSQFTSGNVMLGYMDIFNSIASPITEGYVLFSNVRVEDRSSPPLISPTLASQPQPQTTFTGSNITFSVSATGSPTLAAQWFFNGVGLTNATNLSLSLPHVQTTNAGVYSVVVSNSVGAVWSSSAILTVNLLPFQFSTVSKNSDGSVSLSFNGSIGTTYTLQTSTNLADWSALTNLTLDAQSAIINDTNRGDAERFYRLVTAR